MLRVGSDWSWGKRTRILDFDYKETLFWPHKMNVGAEKGLWMKRYILSPQRGPQDSDKFSLQ